MKWKIAGPYGGDRLLTHAEVPTNVRLPVGTNVRLKTPRAVVRVGYRLGLDDAPPFSDEALVHVEALRALACGRTPATTPSSREALSRSLSRPYRTEDPLRRWWAALWLRSQGMGGVDRGVHVGAAQCSCGYTVTDKPVLGTEWRVTSKRNHRIGVYYPPSGSGEDYADGGLSPATTVVVATIMCLECWERIDAMTGDLEPLT